MTHSSKLLAIIVILIIIISILSRYIMAAEYEKHESKAIGLAMSVSLQTPEKDEYILQISLTSKALKPLLIYHYSLPWESRYSMLLVAVKANANADVIDQALIIDDPGPNTLTIRAGETLVGKISLNERFPNLVQAVRTCDVIIFWSYQLQQIDGAKSERLGGWLLIPKEE